MARMKAVQVPKRGAEFEVVEREIPEPSAGHVRFAFKPAESATATWPQKTACFRAFRIHVFPCTRWLALSTKLEPE